MSPLRPVFYLRRLWRSPAYRLASGGIRGTVLRVVLATALALVMGGCALLCAFPFAEQRDISRVLARVVPAALWRFVFDWNFHLAWVLLAAGLISGLMAFAPERRAGTMEQLVLLDLPRDEIVLARALRALLPLLPAILAGPAAFALVLPQAGSEPRPGFSVGEALFLSAIWGWWLLSAAILIVSFGVLYSLRTGLWKRIAAFAIVAALLIFELHLWHFRMGVVEAIVETALGVAHVFVAAKALIFAGRHFDLLALGVGLDPGTRGAGPRT